MNKIQRNLANYYLFAIEQLIADNKGPYIKVANKIREQEEKIRSYFREKGTLKGCKLTGVGPKTFPILEALMKDDADALNKALQIAFTGHHFENL